MPCQGIIYPLRLNNRVSNEVFSTLPSQLFTDQSPFPATWPLFAVSDSHLMLWNRTFCSHSAHSPKSPMYSKLIIHSPILASNTPRMAVMVSLIIQIQLNTIKNLKLIVKACPRVFIPLCWVTWQVRLMLRPSTSFTTWPMFWTKSPSVWSSGRLRFRNLKTPKPAF